MHLTIYLLKCLKIKISSSSIMNFQYRFYISACLVGNNAFMSLLQDEQDWEIVALILHIFLTRNLLSALICVCVFAHLAVSQLCNRSRLQSFILYPAKFRGIFMNICEIFRGYCSYFKWQFYSHLSGKMGGSSQPSVVLEHSFGVPVCHYITILH